MVHATCPIACVLAPAGHHEDAHPPIVEVHSNIDINALPRCRFSESDLRALDQSLNQFAADRQCNHMIERFTE